MEFAATKGLSSESPAHQLKEVVHKSTFESEANEASARVSLAIDPHGDVKKVAVAEKPEVESHHRKTASVHEETKKSVGIQEKSTRTAEHAINPTPVAAVESAVREAVREVPETVVIPDSAEGERIIELPPSGVRHEDSVAVAKGKDDPAKAEPQAEELPEVPTSMSRILEGLSGGTGTALEPTGDKTLDREIRFRMQAQDTAVLLLLMLIYIIILIFMYSMVYRMSRSESPVRYYCNPSYHRMSTNATDFDNFLTIFNQRPLENKPQIRVAGFNVAPGGDGTTNVWQSGMDSVMTGAQTAWRGKTYDTVFYYALDLDQWTSATGEINEKDQATMKEFLSTTNPLATLVINKEAVWDEFAEVATNIKAKIRESGFEGPIDVTLSPSDRVVIYQNDHWANFMFNETVKVMTLLSVIGGLVYVPYMWIRGSRAKHVVTSKFQVSVNTQTYWKLIEPHISSRGFAVAEGRTAPAAWPVSPPAEEADPVNSDLAAQIMNASVQ